MDELLREILAAKGRPSRITRPRFKLPEMQPVVPNTMLAVRGLRVTRGPNWRVVEDGGPGDLAGTLTQAQGDVVHVVWDDGRASKYRAGDGHDLRVLSNATIGVRHKTVGCDHCRQKPLQGIRWKCRQCGQSLCSLCYHGKWHDLSHPFSRIDSAMSTPVRVAPRNGTDTTELNGLFPGATVQKAPHYWRDRPWVANGREPEEGTLARLLDDEAGGTFKSWGLVEWSRSPKNKVRIGHDGFVDLQCSRSASAGAYFVSHLPAVLTTRPKGAADQFKYDKPSVEKSSEEQCRWSRLVNAEGPTTDQRTDACKERKVKPQASQPPPRPQSLYQEKFFTAGSADQLVNDKPPVRKSSELQHQLNGRDAEDPKDHPNNARAEREARPQPLHQARSQTAGTTARETVDEPGYFASLSGKDAENKLISTDVGTYILRDSESTPGAFVLSVRGEKKVTHYRIARREGGYVIGQTNEFASLKQLVKHFSQPGRPVIQMLIAPLVEEDSYVLYEEHGQFDAWKVEDWAVEELQSIGVGSFGEVFKGVWNGQKVAVKRVNSLGSMDKAELLREAELMKKIHHENIVQLHGICHDPGLIVMEYVENGSVLNYMKVNYRSLRVRDLMRLGEQVAVAMAYLESRKLVHRDLAGRNVLVSWDGLAKVADFGMSRLLQAPDGVYNAGQKHRFAVRWTAPEVFERGNYSVKSDVWSFGVVLMELITFGAVPYRSLRTNEEVKQQVHAGYRLPCPRGCPRELYAVMLECWRADPQARPSFAALQARLPNLSDEVDDLQPESPGPRSPASSSDDYVHYSSG